MLSRFSKLPGVFNAVFQNNHNYDQKVIDKAVSEIKKLGRNSTNNDTTLQAITKILTLMKKYSDSLHIQRVACHALSNLAMQVVVARWIISKGGFNLIKKCLLRFEDDHKLCWLGSSAIWNLARPPANRIVIGQEGVKLMLRVLRNHRDREKVTNTCIGALSNLSLCDSLKDMIADTQSVDLILSVLDEYTQKRSLSVMTSGAGLIANLAVSDEHANKLVTKSAINPLLQLLRWRGKAIDDTLYRNSCAALNNMVSAERFLDSFLELKGVEIIFEFLKTNKNDLYTNLLENCLINVEVDVEERTTSLHLCSLHGRLEILQNLMRQDPFADLDEVDSKHMTCLDYAIMAKDMNIIEFLSKCGAIKYQSNILADNNNTVDEREQIKQAMHNGIQTLHKANIINQVAMCKALPSFPADLCNLMVTFNSNVDMLQALNLYN